MERETKTVTTKSGKVIIIYSYLTGREMDAVQQEAFGSQQIDLNGTKEEIVEKTKKVTLGQSLIRGQKVIEAAMVSFDGSKEEAYSRFRDLPHAEYQEAVTQINSILNADFQPVK